jgi:hypothetical protein
VITLSLIYFGFVGALYGMQFWLPQIVKAFGLTNAQTGFRHGDPYLFGTIAMILWARHSDATRERVAHVGGPLLSPRSRWAASYITDPATTMIVLTVRLSASSALCGVLDAADGVVVGHGRSRWHSADQFDRQPRGFGGPYLIGWAKDADRHPPQRGFWCCRYCRWSPGCSCSSAGTRRRPDFAAAK